jgi:predicted permease
MDASRLGTLLCILAPVFAVIALGRLLGRLGILGEAGARDLHQVVYWVGLPVQLLVFIGGSDVRAHADLRSLGAALAAYWVAFAIAWLATPRLAPEARACVLNGAVRGNGAFIGLPVVLLLGATMAPEARDHLTSAYLVLLGVMVPCFNIGAVLGFLLPHHGVTAHGLRRALTESLTNPLLAGCALGIVVSLCCPQLVDKHAADPAMRAVASTLAMIGEVAVPLALLLVGFQLDFHLIHRNWRLLSLTAAAKLLLSPALTWACALALGLDPLSRTAAVLLMASPTAMASVPMARMLKADEGLMAAIVIATTVAAPLSLLLWLALITNP